MPLDQSLNPALGKAALYGIAILRGYDAEYDEELTDVAVAHPNEVARLQELLEAEFTGLEEEEASNEVRRRQIGEAVEKAFKKYKQEVN